MNTLWHYTCGHGHRGLGARGSVMPNLMAPLPLAWFTDLSVPLRSALGLTQFITRCDRTEYRYRVLDPSNLDRWVLVRRDYNQQAVRMLEAEAGALPMHWWVSAKSVPVTLDLEKGSRMNELDELVEAMFGLLEHETLHHRGCSVEHIERALMEAMRSY